MTKLDFENDNDNPGSPDISTEGKDMAKPSKKRTTKSAKKAKKASAKKKATTRTAAASGSKKTAKKAKAANGETKRFTIADHPILGAFTVIKDSQQHKLLKALVDKKNKPVPITDLVKATGVSNSATYAVLRGLLRKVDEMSPKKYKIDKVTGEDRELSVVLQVK
jgi:hypothetical protein